jgi:hypothetical protein
MSGRNWTDWIRRWSAALAIFCMLAGGISIASILIFGDLGKPQPTASRTPPPPPPPKVPEPREFTIGVVVTAQECPPGGECVYTYTIEPKFIGRNPLPDDELRIEYQVTGGREPQNGEFTVHGTEAKIFKDVKLPGPPGAALKAEATKVVVRPVFGPSLSSTPVPTPMPIPPG